MQLFINLNPNYIVVTSVIVQYKRSIKFYNGTMRRETRRARELNPVFMSPECVVIFFYGMSFRYNQNVSYLKNT